MFISGGGHAIGIGSTNPTSTMMFADNCKLAFGNGSDGELQGLEISLNARLDNYITGFFSGLGASINLALIDSEYTTPEGKVFALPGQSDTNYNASIFYNQCYICWC